MLQLNFFSYKKVLVKIAFCFIFILGSIFSFGEEHSISSITESFIAQHAPGSSQSIQMDEASTLVNKTQHNESSDCSDCVLGFCVHHVTLPKVASTGMSLEVYGNKNYMLDSFFYQNPFLSGFKRPPIA